MNQGEVVSAIRWSILDRLASRGLSFLVLLILARILEPIDFGMVAIASLFGEFSRPFVDMGFSTALIQKKILEDRHKDTAFWLSLGLGVIFAVGAQFLATPIADLFAFVNKVQNPNSPVTDYAIIAKLIRWFGVGLLISPIAGVPTSLLRREFDFKTLAIRNLTGTIVGGVVGIAMAVSGFGVWSLIGQRLSGDLIGTAALYMFGRWVPGGVVGWEPAKQLMGFGSSVTAKSFLTFLNQHSDDILIGMFLGPLALGYYTVAYRLFRQFVLFLTGSVTQVAFPAFSKIQDNEKELTNAFFKATCFSAAVSFPFFMGTAAVANEFVPVFFGEKWIPSIPILQILTVVGMVHSVALLHGNVMVARGKPHLNLVLAVINTIANLVSFVLAVRWGIVAVALVFSIRAVVFLPLGVWFTGKTLSFSKKEYYWGLVPPFCASLAMVSCVLIMDWLLPVNVPLIYVLLSKVGFGLCCYPLFLRLLSPTLYDDLRALAHKVLFPKRTRPDSGQKG